MDPDEEDLPPSERARDRRRDRDAGASARAGMRTGLAKQFKQVLDVQRRRADEAGPRPPRDVRPDDGTGLPNLDRPAKAAGRTRNPRRV